MQGVVSVGGRHAFLRADGELNSALAAAALHAAATRTVATLHSVARRFFHRNDHRGSAANTMRVVPKPMLREIMARHRAPVAITGRPGTVVLFDCNLVHASGHNLSAHDRLQVYVVYNPVTNRPEDVPEPRPDYVRSRNWAPLALEATNATVTA